VYYYSSIKKDKAFRNIEDYCIKFSIPLKRLIPHKKSQKLKKDFGSIAAITHYHVEIDSAKDINISEFVRNEKQVFRFNNANIFKGFEIVPPVEEFIENDMGKSDRPIYYIIAKRGDGKTQTMQYIIRKYLEQFPKLRFFPVDCPVRISWDKDGNIIDFWKYLKRGFETMFEKINEDKKLRSIMDDCNCSEDQSYLDLIGKFSSKQIDIIQEEKGWSDEQMVVEYVKELVREKQYFNKILFFIDELDKPPFEPVIYNFFNNNQNAFSDMFTNRCSMFICASPEWFTHIRIDSDLNFYMGNEIQIPQILNPDQCKSLVQRRYTACGLEPPIKMSDKGYRLILQSSEGVRRTIIDKYTDIVDYCNKNNQTTPGDTIIEEILVQIPTDVREEISNSIRENTTLSDFATLLKESGESYLDAIDFIHRCGDDKTLNQIENPKKRKQIEYNLQKNGFEYDEFKDAWNWLRSTGFLTKSGKLNSRFKDFMEKSLNRLNPENKEISAKFLPKHILREIISLTEDHKGQILLGEEEKRPTPPAEKIKEPKKAGKRKKKESRLKSPPDEVSVDEEIIDVDSRLGEIDDWMKKLISYMSSESLNASSYDSNEALFKAIEKHARDTIYAELKRIFKEKHYGTLSFSPEGIKAQFSTISEDESRLIDDFYSPPAYMKTNVAIYIGVIESFLVLIYKFTTRFRMEDFLNRWISSKRSIDQYQDVMSDGLHDNSPLYRILKWMKTKPKKNCYIKLEDIKDLGIKESDLEKLSNQHLLIRGSVYDCSGCKNEIVLPTGIKFPTRSMPIHNLCPKMHSEPAKFSMKEEDVYYVSQDMEDLFILLYIYVNFHSKERKRIFSKLYLYPKLNGPFTNIDALGITANDRLIGLKLISSKKEINEREIPSIFSAFWYIPRRSVISKMKKTHVMPIYNGNSAIHSWIRSQMKLHKRVPQEEFVQFLSKL